MYSRTLVTHWWVGEALGNSSRKEGGREGGVWKRISGWIISCVWIIKSSCVSTWSFKVSSTAKKGSHALNEPWNVAFQFHLWAELIEMPARAKRFSSTRWTLKLGVSCFSSVSSLIEMSTMTKRFSSTRWTLELGVPCFSSVSSLGGVDWNVRKGKTVLKHSLDLEIGSALLFCLVSGGNVHKGKMVLKHSNLGIRVSLFKYMSWVSTVLMSTKRFSKYSANRKIFSSRYRIVSALSIKRLLASLLKQSTASERMFSTSEVSSRANESWKVFIVKALSQILGISFFDKEYKDSACEHSWSKLQVAACGAVCTDHPCLGSKHVQPWHPCLGLKHVQPWQPCLV